MRQAIVRPLNSIFPDFKPCCPNSAPPRHAIAIRTHVQSASRQSAARLFKPNAVAALLAFEHAKGSSCVGINDYSEESELAAAELTGFVGLVADSGNLLSAKQVHEEGSIRVTAAIRSAGDELRNSSNRIRYWLVRRGTSCTGTAGRRENNCDRQRENDQLDAIGVIPNRFVRSFVRTIIIDRA